MNNALKTVIACAAVAVVATACASGGGPKGSAAGGDFARHGVLTVDLRSNPTTGFSWQCDIADTSVITLKDSTYTPDDAPDGMVGVGGTETFTFACKAAGSTRVTFTYRRPWQGGETDQVRTATATVAADGTGTIVFD